MTKQGLVSAVANESGLTQENVNKMLGALATVLVREIRDNGDQVTIPNLGTFKQKATAAHKGRNPFNGTEVEVKASRTIAFRPASNIKVTD